MTLLVAAPANSADQTALSIRTALPAQEGPAQLTGSAAAPAMQSAAAQPPGSAQEVIVTANKREQNINRVGLTITAITATQLQERRVTNLADIAAEVPGLTFAQSGNNTPILSLRGVGFNSGALGSYPAVSSYVDQVPLPFPTMAVHADFDLERVEVLKGPQGTLFGSNSTGGAINFIAAKPSSTFQAGIDGDYGNFNTAMVDAYVGGPITQTLKFRVAVEGENGDGWQISNSRPSDRNGAPRYVVGRALLDWDPSSRIHFGLSLNAWTDKSQPESGQFVALIPQQPAFASPQEEAAQFSPQNSRAADWSTGIWRPNSDRKFAQVALRGDIHLTDDLTLTSITSYSHLTQKQVEDFDGLPLLITDYAENGHITSFNQELRLANSPKSRLRWVVGANVEKSGTYDREYESFADDSVAVIFAFANSTQDIQYTSQSIRNVAGFANADYDLTSKLTVKGGLRYTDSRIEGSQCAHDPGDGSGNKFINALVAELPHAVTEPFTPLSVNPPDLRCTVFNANNYPILMPYDQTLSQSNVSWRGGLDYKLVPGTLLYGNVSRGYKEGSFPVLAGITLPQYKPVSQESVTAYEGGIKSDLFGRIAHIDAAGFYYDYKNKQVLGAYNDPVLGALSQLVNVPKSDIYGVDSDISIRPVRGLTLSAAIVYLQSRINQYVGFNVFGQPNVNFVGDKLPFAPTWSYNFDVDYRYGLLGGGVPFAGISVQGLSPEDTSPGGSQLTAPVAPNIRVLPGLVHPFETDAYTTVNLRIGYEAPDGSWRVLAYARNLLDTYYWNNVEDQAEANARFPGYPRTYGVNVGFKFR